MDTDAIALITIAVGAAACWCWRRASARVTAPPVESPAPALPRHLDIERVPGPGPPRYLLAVPRDGGRRVVRARMANCSLARHRLCDGDGAVGHGAGTPAAQVNLLSTRGAQPNFALAMGATSATVALDGGALVLSAPPRMRRPPLVCQHLSSREVELHVVAVEVATDGGMWRLSADAAQGRHILESPNDIRRAVRIRGGRLMAVFDIATADPVRFEPRLSKSPRINVAGRIRRVAVHVDACQCLAVEIPDREAYYMPRSMSRVDCIVLGAAFLRHFPFTFVLTKTRVREVAVYPPN
jgi:hypothetical protein